jgi:hypothetical protein
MKKSNGVHVSFWKTPVLFDPNMYPLTFALSVHKTLKAHKEPVLVELAIVLKYLGGSASDLFIRK